MICDEDDNNLSGTIPTEIGQLTKLAGLDIDNNKIVGTIPTVLGNLRLMRELDLDFNLLTGTIPTEFGLMTEAREFDLRKKRIRYSSTTFAYQSKLTMSFCFCIQGDNYLSGPIPREIGNLTHITTLGFGESLIRLFHCA